MPERKPPEAPEVSTRRRHHTQSAPLAGAMSGRCARCDRPLRVLPVGSVCRDCARAQDTHQQHRDPWSQALASLRRGGGHA